MVPAFVKVKKYPLDGGLFIEHPDVSAEEIDLLNRQAIPMVKHHVFGKAHAMLLIQNSH